MQSDSIHSTREHWNKKSTHLITPKQHEKQYFPAFPLVWTPLPYVLEPINVQVGSITSLTIKSKCRRGYLPSQ